MEEERGGEVKAWPAKIGPWGGNGGKAHDIEETPHRLESVTICCGGCGVIDSLAFSYIDRNGRRHTIGPWGGPGGRENRREIQFSLSEFLMEVSGTTKSTAYSPSTVLFSLKFVTNEDAYSFGYEEGTPFSIPMKSNCSIAGFFGRAGTHLHAIGVYVKPDHLTLPMSRGMVWNGKEVIPELEETMEGGKEEDKAGLVKIGPWGGNGGRDLDIMVAPHRLETLTICSDVVVDSLEFSYSEFNGKRHTVGPWGGPGGSANMIRLSHSEFLTRVSGTVGPFHTLPRIITSLTFFTNVGSYGPFGRGGGTLFDIRMQNNGKIVGFFGHAESYVEALGAYIRTYVK